MSEVKAWRVAESVDDGKTWNRSSDTRKGGAGPANLSGIYYAKYTAVNSKDTYEANEAIKNETNVWIVEKEEE